MKAKTSTTTRRETLILIGAAGAALVGCGSTDAGGDGSGSGGGGMGGSGTGGGSGSGTGGSASGSGGSGAVGGTGSGAGGSGSGGANAGGTGTGTGGSGTGGAGEGGAAGSGGSGGVNCETKQETTVGPFPNIGLLDRRDVRGNTGGDTTPKQGAELVLRIRVYDLDNFCAPIANAVVDIWQADAVGDYSSYNAFSTTGQDFLRGYQKTNGQGVAEFLTIFPGSYSGRAIHIHFSIQGQPNALSPNSHGNSLSTIFVSQLYFDPSIIDAIWDAYPIYEDGAAVTPNGSDGIFNSGGGANLIVSMTKTSTGYLGQVDIGVRRSEVGL